ncbi:guanylate kinase [Protofrankia coriariae]|uniref:Guanylate kinase n=1 Tax=Protofrankia coriariae TaxID=1562887 RepID=A0ABR5F6A2_9ACTN|nr:guanylate kinase [Protofrankia coriariae]KLL12187.1 guanylate kinase [Protofrankia coriariae]
MSATRPDAVVLYGPPAAGKDTVTAALTAVDGRYVHFDRLKAGSGKSIGYRHTSAGDLAQLHDRHLIVYANERYGNIYAIDSPRLDEIITAGQIPVVHLGQIAGITALRTGYPARWLTVLLWCPRNITRARLHERGSSDPEERLRVWDETQADLAAAAPGTFTMVLRTDQRTPAAAADLIHQTLTGAPEHLPPVRDRLP